MQVNLITRLNQAANLTPRPRPKLQTLMGELASPPVNIAPLHWKAAWWQAKHGFLYRKEHPGNIVTSSPGVECISWAKKQSPKPPSQALQLIWQDASEHLVGMRVRLTSHTVPSTPQKQGGGILRGRWHTSDSWTLAHHLLAIHHVSISAWLHIHVSILNTEKNA